MKKNTKPAETDTKQPTIVDLVEALKKFSSSSPQALELNCAVAYFIANDAQPFYAVERLGFRTMVAKFNP